MASKLDQLLDSIHPRRTIDEVSGRIDEAINTFSAGSSQITEWDDFRKCLVSFMQHVQARALRSREVCETDLDFCWGLCCRLLAKKYGRNGEKAAFEMARTGNEGGLYAVLKQIARTMADEYSQNEIGARIYHFWDPLSADEKLAATDEYLKKFGHLLPSELTEGSAARIRVDFPKVLQEHPRMLQRIGRTGRT
jgi:hypothetical protein